MSRGCDSGSGPGAHVPDFFPVSGPDERRRARFADERFARVAAISAVLGGGSFRFLLRGIPGHIHIATTQLLDAAFSIQVGVAQALREDDSHLALVLLVLHGDGSRAVLYLLLTALRVRGARR